MVRADDLAAKPVGTGGRAQRTLIGMAVGCFVTAAVLFAQTTRAAPSTVRLKPDPTYDAITDAATDSDRARDAFSVQHVGSGSGRTGSDNQPPQVRLVQPYVGSGFSRTDPDSHDPQFRLAQQHVGSGPGGTVPDGDVPQVLLSRQLMRDANVRVGDVVTLAADVNGSRATSFRIVGVYEPTPDPRKFSTPRLEAHLHLPDLIALAADPADPGSGEAVSAINLALVDRKDADRVAGAIGRRVPGTRVASTEASDEADDPFVVLDRFHWAIAIVTVTGSTAFLLALMVMRAEQRRDIIGILRLIGVSSRSILLEVLLEGLLIAVAGAIFGILVAVAAQGAINRFFQWRFDTTLVFVQVTATIAWQAVAFAVPLGVAAGLAASWTLLRRSVVSLVGR